MFDTINSDWNFPVEQQPIFDQFGNPIQGNTCIMRTDTNEVLGVHGSRYTMVTHDDVVNSIMDAVSDANLSTNYETKFSVIENGRKLRGEILFNDLVMEPEVGDIVKFRVSFFNSYDASWSFSQAADGLRLWCLNGCTSPMGVSRSRFKHTQSISVEGSAAKIALGLDTFMNQKDLWVRWMGQAVENESVENFFKKTIAKAPSRQQLVTKTNEKQLENLLGIWKNERSNLGPNKWALYNALTYWATHTQDLKNPEVARYNREEAIAKAMTTKEWENV